MSNNTNRQLVTGLVLLSGLLLLTACATQNPPDTMVEESEPDSGDIIAVNEPPETITYETDHPVTYIVQKGDTLWDISSMFLEDPWLWPEIWVKNPQIENPHLIYPGDILAIVYVSGEKRVRMARRGENGQMATSGGSSSTMSTQVPGDDTSATTGALKVVKLSPKIREQSIASAIPTIPIHSIEHLLARPQIVDEDELKNSAYVLSSMDDHLINSSGDKLYVRKLSNYSSSGGYQIFRPSKSIYDPRTGELLGHEAIYIGEVRLLSAGDPAIVLVTNSVREILRNDRILPLDDTVFEGDFFPVPPMLDVKGQIISLLDAISMSGQYQTIAINLGLRDGIEAGNLLAINRVGATVSDSEEEDSDFRVKLPDARIGMAIIVRSFEKMSYALVVEAERPVTISDQVVSP